MARPRQTEFPQEQKAALLEKLGEWRRECQKVESTAPISGSIYWAVDALRHAIDGVVWAITGNRQYFWIENNRALQGDRSKGDRSSEAMDTPGGSAR